MRNREKKWIRMGAGYKERGGRSRGWENCNPM